MPRLHLSFMALGALLIVSTATHYSFAQQPTTPPRSPSPANSASADEQQIRQAIVAFVEHYNARKPAEVAALFAPNGRMILRDGSEINGREAIEAAFASAFAQSPKGLISVVVDSIQFLTPDVAVEEGSTTLFPDGETLTTASHYTALHVKKNGRWLMQSVRTVEDESLSAYGELQPLEWLVGEWIDEGRAEVVESSFRWDDNKSFLIEDFQVIRAGSVVLKGTQRIGWDPQARRIRSWIFDNAGGFGEAVWTPVEDQWICKASAVRADGTSASATRTLTLSGKDRVIWTSVDRIAGGEVLPDISVVMVRKPPQPKSAP